MKPFYADDWLTVYGGDCREVLASMPADSVDCVVTSPPYWGLRDYGTATWEGGDAECGHGPDAETLERQNGRASTLVGSTTHQKAAAIARHRCKCGAVRIDSQLGLERTPEEYVANMVAVFAEVRRVCKATATVWVNLGDSFLPGKQLAGIPWRVAFALQADGWYLRSDIIWSKPNPMPESVTDRPTKSHEYLFLLTKGARYYFDADAVREAHTWVDDRPRMAYNGKGNPEGRRLSGDAARLGNSPAGRNIRSVWTIATRPYPGAHFAVFPPELPERCIKAGSSERGVCPECGAPWERVVEREPGFESRRQTEGGLDRRRTGASTNGYRGVGITRQETTGWRPSCGCNTATPLPHPSTQPCSMEGCALWLDHAGEHTSQPYYVTSRPIPAVILDPFAGSGTVGMVANRLSRRAILIDLNPEYLKQQMARNAQTPLGLGAA
jgi:DNA modification methylase